MEFLSSHAINAVFARIAARSAIARGASEEQLFRGTVLTYDGLWQTARISLEDFRKFLNNVAGLPSELPLGFLIGRAHHLATLGPLGSAVGAAPTLRAAIQVLQAFTRLQISYLRLDVEVQPAGLLIGMRFVVPLLNAEIPHAEATIMFLLRHAEFVHGRRLLDAEVRFTHASPAYADLYAQDFDCPVVFGHPRNELLLPMACLDSFSPYYNESLWRQAQDDLAAHLRMLSSSEGTGYRVHVAAYLAGLEPPLPGIVDVARELRVSDRTLHRRLKEEGTTYRELRTAVLMENARRSLAYTGDSVESIAAALGFHDTANFRRAFRQASGMAPSAYRAEQQST